MMKLKIYEIALFGMLGSLMFATKKLMELLPNIHLLAAFIIAVAFVFRLKALFPLYTYVLLDGLFSGFAIWWTPYVYIWLPLLFAVLVIPKNLSKKWLIPILIGLGALHGLSYGLLYAPFQALAFGLSFDGAVAWWIAGLPFDFLHFLGNIFSGLLIFPMILALKKAKRPLS